MIQITCDRCGANAVHRVEMRSYNIEASMSDMDLSALDCCHSEMVIDLCAGCSSAFHEQFATWCDEEEDDV